jgi:hypothetical protein
MFGKNVLPKRFGSLKINDTISVGNRQIGRFAVRSNKDIR